MEKELTLKKLQDYNMEQLIGKLKIVNGIITVNNTEYSYEEYNDPNRPKNFRTVVLLRPGQDSLIFEYDSDKQDLDSAAKNILRE